MYFDKLGKALVGVGCRWQVVGQQGGINFCNFIGGVLLLKEVDSDQAHDQSKQGQYGGKTLPDVQIITPKREGGGIT